MCRLRNIAMRDYQESVTSGQTHRQTDARQSDSYVPLCLQATEQVTILDGVRIFIRETMCSGMFNIHRLNFIENVYPDKIIIVRLSYILQHVASV